MNECDNCRRHEAEKGAETRAKKFSLQLAVRIISGIVALALVFLGSCWIENDYAVQQIKAARGVGIEFELRETRGADPGANFRPFKKAEADR